MKISVILPTKGRGEQALMCVKRFFETTARHPTELIIVAYPDDSNMIFATPLPFDIPPDSSYKVLFDVAGSTECYNLGAQASTGEHLLNIDDDSFFTDGWLDKAYETLHKIPGQHGVVKIHRDNVCEWAELSLRSRRFCVEVLGGVLEVPSYICQYSDVEISMKAKERGLFFESEAFVEHRTWAFGKAPLDDTYRDGGPKYHDIDRRTFLTRQAKGFPIDYAPYFS